LGASQISVGFLVEDGFLVGAGGQTVGLRLTGFWLVGAIE
jgi:hypothetical protein